VQQHQPTSPAAIVYIANHSVNPQLVDDALKVAQAMNQRMVHYVGGPADGYVQLMGEDDHPFVVSFSKDTDSCA
jgi:hypothetical protein